MTTTTVTTLQPEMDVNQVSGPVVRWIGDLYPIEEMTTQSLNQLYSRITSDEACAGDNFDLGGITQKELSDVKREARAAYKELDRELALRRQQAEISRWQESHMPVENSVRSSKLSKLTPTTYFPN
jgi:hypothetical protein